MELSFFGAVEMEQKCAALVDSGSDHVLAAPWIARAIGIDPDDAAWSALIKVGGEVVEAKFQTVTARLHPFQGSLDDYISWECDVGFIDHFKVAAWSVVLGQSGFFDRFTVTMHRGSLVVAVEDIDEFENRFGAQMRIAEDRRRRFEP